MSEKFSVGQVWRAKKPAPTGEFLRPLVNDRVILWIGLETLQYDGPSVGFGQKYRKVTIEAFDKWAAREVTNELPEGEWQSWDHADRSKNK
jgi:hypothetical protein